MSKVYEYRIVEATNTTNLVFAVNALIAHDWQPFGSMTIKDGGSIGAVFCQPMVRYCLY